MNVAHADRGGACSTSATPPPREGRADPRAHGGPARAPRGGAGEPARLPLAAKAEEAVAYEPPRASDARARGRGPLRGTSSSRSTTRAIARSSPTSSSARLSTARSSRGGLDPRRTPAGSPTSRAAAHREARAQGDRDRRRTRSARTSAPTPSEIVRIYSTSGTTGTPSYIPLTAGDLDNWVTGSARSYAASGVAAGQRIVSTYNAGPFVAGAALALVRPHRPLPHPGRHGEHGAAAARDRAAPARGRRAHAVLRRAPRRVGGRARLRPPGVERRARARRGRARRRRAGLPRAARGGLGRAVTEAMGIGDIGISLWGECEEQDGMHLGARGFVHPRADRPGDGRGASRSRTARPASSCSRISGIRRRRSCASARATTSRCGRARARAAAPARACAASARTDDMLIVRGVNVFPSAVRDVVERVRAAGQRPRSRQAARRGREAGAAASGGRRARRAASRRTRTSRRRSVRDCATCSSSRRVSSSCRGGACGGASTSRSSWSGELMRKLQTQGVHHITINGANRQTAIDFWEGVLGMPFVFEQPNLDNAAESHLYFDPGDGRLITVFTNEEREPEPKPTPREPGFVHHLAFSLSQATFAQAVERLDERGIRALGRQGPRLHGLDLLRGSARPPVELASYRFEPPPGTRTRTCCSRRTSCASSAATPTSTASTSPTRSSARHPLAGVALRRPIAEEPVPLSEGDTWPRTR